MQLRSGRLVFIFFVAVFFLAGTISQAQDEIANEMNQAESAAGPGAAPAQQPAAPAAQQPAELPQGDLAPDRSAPTNAQALDEPPGPGDIPLEPAPQTDNSSSRQQQLQQQPAAENPAAEQPEAAQPETAPPPEAQTQTPPAADTATAPVPVPIVTEHGTQLLPAEDFDEPEEPGKICECRFVATTPYRDRRSTLGGFVGFQYSQYAPVNYQPDFSNPTSTGTPYSNEYGSASGLFELVFGAKWNNFLGSLGLQMSVGSFQANSITGDGAALSVITITTGLIYAMDALFKEPYVVPYAGVGMYTGIYSETAGGEKVGGSSAFAPYYSVGLMFQLDWIDEISHTSGYEDWGLENTFLYLEARSFLPASNAIADLSTPLQIGGGLKVEF